MRATRAHAQRQRQGPDKTGAHTHTHTHTRAIAHSLTDKQSQAPGTCSAQTNARRVWTRRWRARRPAQHRHRSAAAQFPLSCVSASPHVAHRRERAQGTTLQTAEATKSAAKPMTAHTADGDVTKHSRREERTAATRRRRRQRGDAHVQRDSEYASTGYAQRPLHSRQR